MLEKVEKLKREGNLTKEKMASLGLLEMPSEVKNPEVITE